MHILLTVLPILVFSFSALAGGGDTLIKPIPCAQIVEGQALSQAKVDWSRLVEEKLDIQHGSLRVSISNGSHQGIHGGHLSLQLDGYALDHYGGSDFTDWISPPWVLNSGYADWSVEQRNIFQALVENLVIYAGFKYVRTAERAMVKDFDAKYLKGPWAALNLPAEKSLKVNGLWVYRDKLTFSPDLAAYFESLIDRAPILNLRQPQRFDPKNLIRSLSAIGFDSRKLTFKQSNRSGENYSVMSLDFFYGTYHLGAVNFEHDEKAAQWSTHSQIFDDGLRGRGVGQALYLIGLFEFQRLHPGASVRSLSHRRSDSADGMWRKLLEAGLARTEPGEGGPDYVAGLDKIAALRNVETLTHYARRP